MLSATVIVYIQVAGGWVVGFGVPFGLMLLSTIIFLLGSPLYIVVMANKSLFTGFVQVLTAAWEKRHLPMPHKNCDGQYYHEGSNLIAPTDKLRYINNQY